MRVVTSASFICFIFSKVPASHWQKEPFSQTFHNQTWHESQGELGKPGLGTCLIVLRSEEAWPSQISFQNSSFLFFLHLQIANVNQSNAHLNAQLSHEKCICQKRDWILCLWILVLMQQSFSTYYLKWSFYLFLSFWRGNAIFSIEQKQDKPRLYYKFLRIGCQLLERILGSIFSFL